MIWLVIFSVPSARAVPSYSRQTGMPCASCHYAPPELTPFGRTFKLEGYTFTTKPEVSDDKKDHNSALHLLEAFPLSVIFDTSFTATKSPQPTTQNGNFQFPQAASLFLAGCLDESYGEFCTGHLLPRAITSAGTIRISAMPIRKASCLESPSHTASP